MGERLVVVGLAHTYLERACTALKDANDGASPLESYAILQMLHRVRVLESDLAYLVDSLKAEEARS